MQYEKGSQSSILNAHTLNTLVFEKNLQLPIFQERENCNVVWYGTPDLDHRNLLLCLGFVASQVTHASFIRRSGLSIALLEQLPIELDGYLPVEGAMETMVLTLKLILADAKRGKSIRLIL